MSENLTFCPCCGNEDIRTMEKYYQAWTPLYYVACTSCGMRTSEFREKEEAIKRWNKRVSSWIRTSEQKPEKCEVVLVYTGEDNGVYIEACAEVLEWTGDEFFDYRHSFCGYTPEKAPFWMSIPDLPEVGE